MDAARWDRVQALFLEAADLPASRQTEFLDSACTGDAELRAEVEGLLDSERLKAHTLSSAVAGEAELVIDTLSLVGARLGPYRIVREVGRGGMGSVYLAVRDDQQYEKNVAIKVVRHGLDTAEVLSRFRRERQILASLDHPSIARLLDAGTTADGRPFLVMDYVDGVPLDSWRNMASPEIREVCRLFIKIADAVSYAHRNLIVHRDLKPVNIFVARDGSPKLLDFGVAGLLGDGVSQDLTVHFNRQPFTPDYASPEQARGVVLTTSTDIYSLGLIFYEMLTGVRARKISSSSSIEIERAICESDIPSPRTVVPKLDADLDNIVSMAIRKEPELRYASVEQMAADVERYLEGRPILARPGTASYRARKFIARHRLSLAAAMIGVLSLAAAAGTALVQSRRAEAARVVADERREEAERARNQARIERDRAEQERQAEIEARAAAERRLNDLLSAADTTLFGMHDAIAALPGAIEARRALVTGTLDYLNRVPRTNAMDDRLTLLLATGYSRIASLQANPYEPSLGDYPAARESYTKAEALLTPLFHAKPNDPVVLGRWIEVQMGIAETKLRTGDREGSAKAFYRLLPEAHHLATLRSGDQQALSVEPDVHGRLAFTLRISDPERALSHSKRQAELLENLNKRFPDDGDLKNQLGASLSQTAVFLKDSGDLAGADNSFLRSIAIREEALRRKPHDVRIRRDLMVVYGNYATLLGLPWSANLGRFDEAREYSQKAVSLAREAVQADPRDNTARSDLANALVRLGTVPPRPEGTATSLAALEESMGYFEDGLRRNPKSEAAGPMALAREYAGYRLQSLHRYDAAGKSFLDSLAAMEAAMSGPVDPAGVVQALADEEALSRLAIETRDRESALDYAKRAVRRAELLAAGDAGNENRQGRLAEALYTLACALDANGQGDDARSAAARAVALWQGLRNPGLHSFYRHQIEHSRVLAGMSPSLSSFQR